MTGELTCPASEDTKAVRAQPTWAYLGADCDIAATPPPHLTRIGAR
jgi:hypothetical protein